MSPLALVIAILGLALLGWLSARARAMAFAAPGAPRLHSLPGYHGWYVAIWAALPALLFLLLWVPLSDRLVMDAVMGSPAAANLPPFQMQRNAILQETRELAEGLRQSSFHPEARALAPIYDSALSRYRLIGAVAALLLAFAGGAFAYSRIGPAFRARTRVERLVMLALLLASLIAILTTLGIVLSLLFESLRTPRTSPPGPPASRSAGSRSIRTGTRPATPC